METNYFTTRAATLSALVLLLASPAFAADKEMSNEEIAKYFSTGNSDGGDWPRHFRVGALVGMNIKADFKIGGSFGVSGNNPGPVGQAGKNHFYDDGYVLVDDSSNAGGWTSYYGYSNTNQFNAGAQTLTFHSSSAYSTADNSSADADMALGVDLAYGGHLFRYGRALVGWEFGFGYLPINVKDTTTLSATVQRVAHQFSTGGTIPPSPPYSGGSSGIGSHIHDVATEVAGDTKAGTVTGSRELDVTLYNFRLGPTLHWELGKKWAVSASVGGAAALLDGELKFDETLTILSDNTKTSNKGSAGGGTHMLYGYYAGATLLYHAEDKGDFYISAQYMPLGKAKFGGGGRQSNLDVSGGLYLSAGINWPF